MAVAADSLVIETKGLSKTFKGVQALKNLDLHVHPNSIFAFLGPNGAGKTTTIKLLLGLIYPTGGYPFAHRLSAPRSPLLRAHDCA